MKRTYYSLTIWEMDLTEISQLWLHDSFRELIMQYELCPSTGRPHYQGGIRFFHQVPFASFKQFVQAYLPGKIAVKYDNKEGNSWNKMVNYCSGQSGNALLKCADLSKRYRLVANKEEETEGKGPTWQQIPNTPLAVKIWTEHHALIDQSLTRERLIEQRIALEKAHVPFDPNNEASVKHRLKIIESDCQLYLIGIDTKELKRILKKKADIKI